MKCKECPLTEDKTCAGEVHFSYCPNKKEYPSFLEQAGNLMDSLTTLVVEGFDIASNELIEARKQVCNTCEWKDHAKNACIRCGCNLSAKVFFANWDCPDNPSRWSHLK